MRGTGRSGDVLLVEDIFDEGFEIEAVGTQPKPEIQDVTRIEDLPINRCNGREAARVAVLGSNEGIGEVVEDRVGVVGNEAKRVAWGIRQTLAGQVASRRILVVREARVGEAIGEIELQSLDR